MIWSMAALQHYQNLQHFLPLFIELGKRLSSQALKNKTQLAESVFKATFDFYPRPLKLFHWTNSFTTKPQRASVSFVVVAAAVVIFES